MSVSLFTRRPRPEDSDEDDFDSFPAAAAPAKAPRPIELRDWEIPAGYAVAGLIVLLAILELTVTHGKGAPKHPSTILPLVALAVGLAQAATIRFKNRLLTGILGVAGGLLIAYVPVPTALGIPHSIGFLVPFVYAFLVTQRHSRAQRALQGPRTPRQGSSRRGSKAAPPEPAGPKASRRYTPPKAKEERSRRR